MPISLSIVMRKAAALLLAFAVGRAAAAEAVDYSIGVISGDGTCPAGAETVRHSMDEEDSYCANGGSYVLDAEGYPSGTWSLGWTGALSTYLHYGPHGGGVNFTWCKVDGTQFKPLTAIPDPSLNYAVLKLGTACPPGSEEFSRYFDNEDGAWPDYNNSNWVSGNLGPNSVGTGKYGNTMLYFCLFRRAPFTMSQPPNLGVPYGVFALPSFGGKPFPFALESGYVHSNEERNYNANRFWGGASDADARRIVHPIDMPRDSAGFSCGSMTVLNVVKMSAGTEPRCGSCGGTVLPGGACSVPTPPRYGGACGAGGTGRVLCNGMCTVEPSPASPALVHVITSLMQ